MKHILLMFMLALLSMQVTAQTKKVAQAKTSPTIIRKTMVITKTKTSSTAKPSTTTQGNKTTQSSKTANTKSTTTAKSSTATAKTTSATKAAATTSSTQKDTAVSKKEEEAKKETATQSTCGYLCNVPLPYMPQKLDVLFIGNSFSLDTSAALPELFRSMNINNVNVYVLYRGGCSMKQHYESFKNEDKVYDFYRYNQSGEQLLERGVTISDVMQRYAYDVVVFQQYSLESGDYTTYEPYLSRLIQAYNITKQAARTTFAFNETWAYSSTNKNIAKYKNPTMMWKNICASVKKMKAASGIDIIIPCGTAVQNARSVELLNVDNELTRDGTHINYYAGRYLLACTFFETIIAPCMNRSLRDDRTIFGKVTDPGQVNDENRRLLQNCARLAVANNYEISEFAGQ